MPTFRNGCLKLALFALTVAIVDGSGSVMAQENSSAKERELIGVLESDAAPADKAITCKELAVWGGADAVPALAALLPDEELSSWARIALEAIPDPSAGRALCEALETVEGLTLIGVINSVGVRRDAQAIDKLTELMGQSNVEAASAAAVALGKIGKPAAVATLRKKLTNSPKAIRSAVAEGCILCAERLAAEGKLSDAAQLYEEVRQADVPKQRLIEATRGVILAQGAEGVPLLIEQLKSGDKQFAFIALAAARELAAPGATAALLSKLDDLPPAQKSQLILALADRRDEQALPAMLEAAENGTPQVRLAAIDFLKQAGNESCVPVLLAIAAAQDAGAAQAALSALESLPGDGVDALLAARLPQARNRERLVLIQLFGSRRIRATPALFAAAKDNDRQVRNAALTALGEVIELVDLAALIRPVVQQTESEDASAAQHALRQACVRMPDREACAKQLSDALSTAPLPAKLALLESLGAMGGTHAVETLGAAAKSDNPQLQDAATRLLGAWMTLDAAPVLLELAKAPGGKYKIRALRGYIRLARQFVMPIEQRAAMCRRALGAAKRETEQRLVLEIVQRYPSIEMLEVAVAAAKLPRLQGDATAAAVVVAKKIGESPESKALLEQVGK